MIEFRKVTKRYGEVSALEDFSLTIADGDLVGLVGGDGAGKTTVLRMILGLVKPDSGTVSVHGEANGRGVCGYVSQQFSLYDDLTCYENIVLIAHLHNLEDGVEVAAEQVLRFTNMWEFRDRMAGHLSGGMRQKLSLAAALVHQPQTLILDEPNTGIDALSRREFWNLLNRIHRAGRTIVLATPYFNEGEYCRTAVLLHKGRILAVGAPADLRRSVGGKRLENVFWALTKGAGA